MRAILVFLCLVGINLASCCGMEYSVSHPAPITEEECQLLDAKIQELNISRRQNKEEPLNITSIKSISGATADSPLWFLIWGLSYVALVCHFFRKTKV